MMKVEKNKKRLWIMLGILISCVPVSKVQAASFSLEADAAAFALKGFSLIIRNTFDSGLDIALGGGKFDLPQFLVESEQENFDETRWKAACNSIQVFRIGYRFSKSHEDGFVTHVIAMNQRWNVVSPILNEQVNFSVVAAGLSGGYEWHVYKGFYLYPTAALTLNKSYDGSTKIQNNEYHVPLVAYSGSLHVGYEF